jgi:predicted TIM-barrel fold metal-dependent hydrolase
LADDVIPFFDSLTHVTSDGKWFDTHHDGSTARLLECLGQVHSARACLVGIDGYNMPNEFLFETCRRHPESLVPVAGFTPGKEASKSKIQASLQDLKARGFRAIKIHPTLCDVHLDSPEFDRTMESCAAIDMPVFLCTIMRRRNYLPKGSPADLIYATFVRHAGVKVLLLHGGLSEVMVYADLVRALPNALLDLSLTLLKYGDSSLDQDFAYLFRTFDRRVAIGSDFPEWTPAQARDRALKLGASIPRDKMENVLWRNLSNFLGFPT